MAETLSRRHSAEPLLPPPRAPLLEMRGLSVTAGGREILRRVDLDVRPGEVLGILGPSGAGKSTLLKCLNRMVDLEPELAVRGDVRFCGTSLLRREVDPDRLRTCIGTLFQQPVVFPRSVFENVVFGVRHLRLAPRAEWPARAEEVLRRVHLWDEVRTRMDHLAAELSIGQQQRLCLARALALSPEVILMDEPTSALDGAATAAIERLIRELAGPHTLVLVTHDVEQARRVCDRLACLCLRDGAGEMLGDAVRPEAFEDPACSRVIRELESGGATR